MTEGEWLDACDPEPLLEFLRESASERKLRLFAVSAVWQLAVSLGDANTNKVIEVVSQAAEGAFNRSELRDERRKIGRWGYPTVPALPASEYVTCAAGLGLESDPLSAALSTAYAVSHLEAELQANLPDDQTRDLARNEARRHSRRRLVSLVWDIFGNPFRSAGIKRQWRTSTVLTLAQQMYDSRDFSTMLILADALQDAGCVYDDMLNHCRGPGPHVRGCWVVDAILGKA